MIVLHVGAHKTASTHLQQGLRTCRAELDKGGIQYLDPTDLRADGFRLGLIADGGPGNDAAARRFASAVAGMERLLLSEENILGLALGAAPSPEVRLYPDAASRLARVIELFQGRPVQLCLAVRDPAGFLASTYGKRLLGGVIQPFESFLGGRDPTALRWTDLAVRLLRVGGVRGLTVWRYEDWPAIAPAVFAAMLPDALARRVRLGKGLAHPGLSARAHDQVMKVLAAGEVTPDIARRARAQFPKKRGVPGLMPFGMSEQKRIAAAYAADLAELGRIPRVEMLPDGPSQTMA